MIDKLLHMPISESSPVLWIIVLGVPLLLVIAIAYWLVSSSKGKRGFRRILVGLFVLWVARLLSSLIRAYWLLPPARHPTLGVILAGSLNPFQLLNVIFDPVGLAVLVFLAVASAKLFRK